MKTKKSFVNIVCFALIIGLLVCCMSTVANASTIYPWNRTVPYATTFHIFAEDQDDSSQYSDDIENEATLGTYTFADARTNRFRIKFNFNRSSLDRGPSNSNVKVTIKVTKSDGITVINEVVEPNSSGYASFDSGWITGVSMGEKVTVWVDISTATGYTGNGNYRTACFNDFAIYYD